MRSKILRFIAASLAARRAENGALIDARTAQVFQAHSEKQRAVRISFIRSAIRRYECFRAHLCCKLSGVEARQVLTAANRKPRGELPVSKFLEEAERIHESHAQTFISNLPCERNPLLIFAISVPPVAGRGPIKHYGFVAASHTARRWNVPRNVL
jgi:hypothetical protein